MIRHLGVLIAGTLAFWGALLGLGWLLWDHVAVTIGAPWEVTVTYSAVAVLLCLLPAAATLLWVSRGRNLSPEQQLMAVLGGTGVRMFFVLGAGMVLNSLVPYFQRTGFWIWILIFYLFTLALEMVVVVRARAAAERQGKQPGPTT